MQIHKIQETCRRIVHVQYHRFYEAHLKNSMQNSCQKPNTLTDTVLHINQAKATLLMVTFVTPQFSSYCPLVEKLIICINLIQTNPLTHLSEQDIMQ